MTSTKLRFPDYVVKVRMVLGIQPYVATAFTTRNYTWYSFLLEGLSMPGPQGDQKDYFSEKFK